MASVFDRPGRHHRPPVIAIPPQRAQLKDILVGIPTDDVAEVLGRALIDAHGASIATGIVDKIGRLAHFAAREGR